MSGILVNSRYNSHHVSKARYCRSVLRVTAIDFVKHGLLPCS